MAKSKWYAGKNYPHNKATRSKVLRVSLISIACAIFVAMAIFLCIIFIPSIDKPNPLRYEYGVLHWDAVDGAKKYELEIDGVSYFSNTNEYDISHIPIGDRTIRVRAIDSGIAQKKSKFTAPQQVYALGGINLADNARQGSAGLFKELETSYIGAGINVVNRFVSSQNAIISKPIFQYEGLKKQPLFFLQETKTDISEISGQSADEYIQNLNASLNASAKWFGGSLDIKANFSQSERNESHIEFKTLDVNIRTGYLSLRSENIQDMRAILTSGFENDLYNPLVSPSKLFDDYGTHWLASGQIGGRALSNYYMASNNYENITKLSLDIATQLRYGVSINGSANMDYMQQANSKNVYISNTLSLLGGNPMYNIKNDLDLVDHYDEWLRGVVESPALMGLKDAQSLVSITDLIDRDRDSQSIYSMLDGSTGTRVQQLQEYFEKYHQDSYNELVKQYGIRELDKITDIVVTVNGEKEDELGYYYAQAGAGVNIGYTYQPSNVIMPVPPSISIDKDSQDNAYIQDNQLQIVAEPTKEIVTVRLRAGNIVKSLNIKVGKLYKVDFIYDGKIQQTNTVLKGSTVAKPDSSIVKDIPEYYEFIGWYKDAQCLVEYNFNESITDDTKIYAKVAPIVYTINLYNVDGWYYTTTSVSIINGSPKFFLTELQNNQPTKTGYDFGGWYTTPIFTQGTEFDHNRGEWTQSLSNNPSLYAKWQGQNMLISYFANSGSGRMDNTEYLYGQQSITLATNLFVGPYATSQFVEWNTQADGNGKGYFQNASFIDFKAGTTLNLYAIWYTNAAKLTLINPLDGDTQSYELSQNQATEIKNPFTSNLTLAGWATTQKPDKVDFIDLNSISIEIDTTLYAIWYVKLTFPNGNTLSGYYGNNITLPDEISNGYKSKNWIISGVQYAPKSQLTLNYKTNIDTITFTAGIEKSTSETYNNGSYEIWTRNQLQGLINITNKASEIQLMADINLGGNNSGTGVDWNPLPAWVGPFYGNGKTLTNLQIKIANIAFNSKQYFGLFTQYNGAMSDLTIDGISIIGTSQHSGQVITAGAVAGMMTNATITNVHIKNAKGVGTSVLSIENYVGIRIERNIADIGGLVGEAGNTLIQHSSATNIAVYTNGVFGGIAGYLRDNSKISQCAVDNINAYIWIHSANRQFGGLVGEMVRAARIEYSNIKNISVNYWGWQSAMKVVYPEWGFVVGAMTSSSLFSIGGESEKNTLKLSIVSPVNGSKLLSNEQKYVCNGGWGFIGRDNGGNSIT